MNDFHDPPIQNSDHAEARDKGAVKTEKWLAGSAAFFRRVNRLIPFVHGRQQRADITVTSYRNNADHAGEPTEGRQNKKKPKPMSQNHLFGEDGGLLSDPSTMAIAASR